MFAQVIQYDLTSARSAASVYKNLCNNDPISAFPSHQETKFGIWALYPANHARFDLRSEDFGSAAQAKRSVNATDFATDQVIVTMAFEVQNQRDSTHI